MVDIISIALSKTIVLPLYIDKVCTLVQKSDKENFLF